MGDLGEKTGLNQANLSKHLQLLHAREFVNRRKDGLFVYYSLKDNDVFQLCDIMCGRLGAGRASATARARDQRERQAATRLSWQVNQRGQLSTARVAS